MKLQEIILREVILQGCAYFETNVLFPLAEKLKAIWKHVREAYHVQPLPIVKLPPHEEGRKTYSKKVDWAKNLDKVDTCNDESYDLTADLFEKATPLHVAALRDKVKAIHCMIRDEADVNALDIREQSPAYWAAYRGSLSALMVLSSFGAKLDQSNHRGKTLLSVAAKYGHIDVVRFLISKGVPLNAQDKRGLTALHVAAFYRQYEVFEALVYAGANQTIKDSEERTPQQLLEAKCKEVYHNRMFPLRIVTSPNPPPLIQNFERLIK